VAQLSFDPAIDRLGEVAAVRTHQQLVGFRAPPSRTHGRRRGVQAPPSDPPQRPQVVRKVLPKRGFDDGPGNAHDAAAALGQDVVRFRKMLTEVNLRYCRSTGASRDCIALEAAVLSDCPAYTYKLNRSHSRHPCAASAASSHSPARSIPQSARPYLR